MSQSQVANAVGKSELYARQFLDGKWLEGELYKDYTPVNFEVENNGNGKRGSSRIKPVAVSLASEFWLEQAIKGNIKAQALAQEKALPTTQGGFSINSYT